VEAAFRHAGIEDYQRYLSLDPALVRPREAVVMTPDLRETEQAIGWRPKTRFPELVGMLVDAALERRKAPAP
jgi:GDPmannose 4,6-dehydratase